MLASGVVLGLIAGFVLGRSWRPLSATHVRWIPLLLIGFASRGVAPALPAAAFALYVFALVSTTLVAAVNVRIVGTALIAIGGALNLAVVALNGGMPVDAGAVIAAGATMPTDALHVTLGDATRLSLLGDVIAVPLIRSVYSIGDFCIALGGFLVPFVLLVRR